MPISEWLERSKGTDQLKVQRYIQRVIFKDEPFFYNMHSQRDGEVRIDDPEILRLVAA